MNYTIENTTKEPISFVYWKTGMKQTLQPGEFIKVTAQSEEQLNFYEQQMKEFKDEDSYKYPAFKLPDKVPYDGVADITFIGNCKQLLDKLIQQYEAQAEHEEYITENIILQQNNLKLEGVISCDDKMEEEGNTYYYFYCISNDTTEIWDYGAEEYITVPKLAFPFVYNYTTEKVRYIDAAIDTYGVKFEDIKFAIPYQLELNTEYDMFDYLSEIEFNNIQMWAYNSVTANCYCDYIKLVQGDTEYILNYDAIFDRTAFDFSYDFVCDVFNSNYSIYARLVFNSNMLTVINGQKQVCGLHFKEFIPSDTTTVDFGTRNIANIDNVLFNLIYNDGTYMSKIFDVNKPFSEFYNPVEPHTTLSSAQLDNNAIEHIAEEPVLKHYTFNLYDANNNLLYSQGSGSFRQINISLNSLPEDVRQLFDDYYSPSLNYYFAVNYDERAEEEGLGGLYLIAEHSLD